MRNADHDLKICNAATRGPWYREKTGATFKGFSTETIIADTAPCCTENRIYADAGDSYPASDADFIALSREALPYWIKRAQELEMELLKGISKKIIRETADELGKSYEYEYEHYRCPGCGNILHQRYIKSKEAMRYNQNYCHDCGQKLDWNLKEDENLAYSQDATIRRETKKLLEEFINA